MNILSTKLLPCPKIVHLLFALNCILKTSSFLIHPTSTSSRNTASDHYSSPVRICFQSSSTTPTSNSLITPHQRTTHGGSEGIGYITRGNKKIRATRFLSGTLNSVTATSAAFTLSHALTTFRNNLTNAKVTLWKDKNYVLAAIVSHLPFEYKVALNEIVHKSILKPLCFYERCFLSRFSSFALIV
jgi:hypothetical protein